MQRLTLGELTFLADSAGIGVMVGNRADPVALSRDEVEKLESFLRRHGTRERRIGFRVALAPLQEEVRNSFRVQIRVGARILVVPCIDLSLTGILVEVAGLTLQRGAEVPIRLNLDELECRLVGSVVRVDEGQLAMHFVQSLQNGELNPPEPLLAMYRTLETEWLRTRRADD